MSIGTPVSLGTNSGAGTGTTIALTASAAIQSGDLVLVYVVREGTATVTGVTDGTNTYSQVGTAGIASSGTTVDLWAKANASAVASPTITATITPTEFDRGIAAIRCPGISVNSPLDKNTGQANQSGASASVSTGTLSYTTELVVGAVVAGSGLSSFTESANFTSVISQTPWGASWYLDIAYDIVSSASSVSYAPSWTSSVNFATFLVSYKGALQNLSATAGSYAITGAAATLAGALHLTLGSASYTLTGFLVQKGWGVVATAGSYALTGFEMVQDYFPKPVALVRKIKAVLQQVRSSKPTLSK